MTENPIETKQKIINFIESHGPSLPVQIARESNTDTLFASAFLSELIAEKRIKISTMKVGTSPLYYIENQEPQLEKFAEQYLKGKEKEAFNLLKQNKILEDSKQHPPIRVALRALKDFAEAFQEEGKVYWKYYLASEKGIQEENTPKEMIEKETEKEIIFEEPLEEKLDIFEKPKEPQKIPQVKKPKKPKQKKTTTQKTNQKFFNKIKEFILSKNMEISDILEVEKNKLSFKIKKHEQEFLIIAFNKKRVNEEDLIKSYEKASNLGLRYIVLSKGEQTKKLHNMINASKELEEIGKFE